MSGGLAELLNAAETGGVRSAEEILEDDEFVDANTERCIEASEEMYSALAECTNSEASTIARSVTGLDGVEVWARLHAKLQQTLGNRFRVQRECVYPRPAKDVSQVRLAILQWGREVEGHDVCTRRRCEDSRLVEDVGPLGKYVGRT